MGDFEMNNHAFLNKLSKGDIIDSIYLFDSKASQFDTRIGNPYHSKSGTPYVILKVYDNSLEYPNRASIFVPFSDPNELSFLSSNSSFPARYLRIVGEVMGIFPSIQIWGKSVSIANAASGIVFDTSDLYSPSSYFRNKLVSSLGLENVALRHTSIESCQENLDIIGPQTELRYERIINSPYDRNQINVYLPEVDEPLCIPAYLTPTISQLFDDGYTIQVSITDILEGENGKFGGIRVRIIAKKKE